MEKKGIYSANLLPTCQIKETASHHLSAEIVSVREITCGSGDLHHFCNSRKNHTIFVIHFNCYTNCVNNPKEYICSLLPQISSSTVAPFLSPTASSTLLAGDTIRSRGYSLFASRLSPPPSPISLCRCKVLEEPQPSGSSVLASFNHGILARTIGSDCGEFLPVRSKVGGWCKVGSTGANVFRPNLLVSS
ncbi:hypothetical protein MIMGU_mgv1a014458mg [Erythranthe guttata]|uniref:Uncharacterized protein n=1 Tax=Erythranthe guttata TaxID=4155 RepID=A0A022RVJ4_ERYGU|nr:hypothetical protein MIMGU_mgv1a014458mg [Erythranthe guttata]